MEMVVNTVAGVSGFEDGGIGYVIVVEGVLVGDAKGLGA